MSKSDIKTAIFFNSLNRNNEKKAEVIAGCLVKRCRTQKVTVIYLDNENLFLITVKKFSQKMITTLPIHSYYKVMRDGLEEIRVKKKSLK